MNTKFVKKFNVLSIIVSKQCNGSCDYCLFTPNEKDCKFLSFSTIEKIIQIIQSFELNEYEIPYKLSVQIVGGEPLLFVDNLCNLMDFMIKSCPKIDFIFNIYTNGCNISQQILKKLNEFPITITFSLDEIESNNTHRFFNNKPMNQVTAEKLIMAHSLYPNIIRTNTVISEINYKELFKLFNFHKKYKIWKWGWGFMRARNPEEAEWKDSSFQEMSKIIEEITKEAQNYPFILYNILEYGQTKRKNMTTENIPLYINLDETISTLSGDNCFRVPIKEFDWKEYFNIISQFPELYFLNDSEQEENLTECIHCHYREKHLLGKLNLPLSQCKWSMLLRSLYNQYYKEKIND